MFFHQLAMPRADHDDMPAAHENKVKGEKPNNRRIVIAKARDV